MSARKTTEWRVLERVAENRGERVHLAALDTSRSLCGHITFDGSPFDDWQIVDEDCSPEDVDGERCLTCWESWEIAKREDRERRGLWNPPERTHVRAKRRKVAPQVASQRIAVAMPEPAGPVPANAKLLRMYRQELEALGTADALAELCA